MNGLMDCHVHTAACGHATGDVGAMYAAAKDAGLLAVVFTEHLPLPDALDLRRHLSPDRNGFAQYAEAVLELRRYASPDDPLIVLGAEADWLPDDDDHALEVMAWARDLGVELFLGSVHFIGRWAFDDPHDIAEWNRRDVDIVWGEYFDLWCEAARSGRFDVMAHPDLIKKFGFFPAHDLSKEYERAAAAAASSGVLIEISSAGLRKPVGEQYPSLAMLRAFRAAGVGVTTGSDAHAPDEVGAALDAMQELARTAGYEDVQLPVGAGARKSVRL